MKTTLLAILIFVLVSCSTRKVTEFHIRNENEFPITVTVRTNNIRQTFLGIKAHEEFHGVYDWTQIEKKEGQWIFLIKNEVSGGSDSFAHGYFTNGELNSFADLICKGSELKVQISE